MAETFAAARNANSGARTQKLFQMSATPATRMPAATFALALAANVTSEAGPVMVLESGRRPTG
eukprot:1149110-Alexandrium_andersonii.AAC.1